MSLFGVRCDMTRTIAITHTPATQLHYNGIRPCAVVDVDWTYGTVSYWLWTHRKYVGIGACLNLNVSLLSIRYTMTPSRLHTCLLLNCNDHDNDIRLCAEYWLNTWNGIVLVLDEQEVSWYYWCMFTFVFVISWYTKIQLQWQWHTALHWC